MGIEGDLGGYKNQQLGVTLTLAIKDGNEQCPNYG